MYKLLPLLALLLFGCSPLRIHEVSPGLKEGLKQPFTLTVSSDPRYLEGQLTTAVTAQVADLASIIPSEEGGTVKVEFRSNPSLTTDTDGQQPFMTDPGSSPRKRHIFQSSEIEMTIMNREKEVLWHVKYKYEGRNDFKASYTQKPEEAMEECVKRIFDLLRKDLVLPPKGANP